MLSSKDGLGVWLHDQLSTRNKFYTNPVAKSSITVSANQDPSAVKMYKSLSLETNTKDWTAEVCTNVEYESEEKQKGSISSFEKKEGFQYAEMPRDVLNSTRNIVGKPFTVSSSIEEYGYQEAFAINTEFLNEFEQLELEDFFGSPVPTNTILSFFSVFAEASSFEDFTYSYKGKARLYVVQDEELLEEFIMDDMIDSKRIWVIGAKNYQGRVLLMLAAESTFTYSSPAEGLELLLEPQSPVYNFPLVIAVKPEIDGDQLRGPYANVEISTQTDKHAEIHAINVDYEFSKLDKRLTQNT